MASDDAKKYSLGEQRIGVEYLLTRVAADVDPGMIARAHGACKTLTWFEERAELTRELVRLDREAPAILAVLRQVPGATITDVRMYEDD